MDDGYEPISGALWSNWFLEELGKDLENQQKWEIILMDKVIKCFHLNDPDHYIPSKP